MKKQNISEPLTRFIYLFKLLNFKISLHQNNMKEIYATLLHSFFPMHSNLFDLQFMIVFC